MSESTSDNPWLNSSAPRGRAYDEGFERLAAAGQNVHGEADFVESFGVASVLDAGCGTGRIAIELARRGVQVIGVDLDPLMLAVGREKAPGIEWIESDLAALDLGRRFDAIVAAGNVFIFLTAGTEDRVLERLSAHLADEGVLVAGFTLRPGGLTLEHYDRLAASHDLQLLERWATWDYDELGRDPGYAVSVHQRR